MPPFDLAGMVPAHIRDFEPYIPGKPDSELMKLYGCDHLWRLNNNENPLGPPPGAREVIRRFEETKASLYPSGDSYFLRLKLAEKYSLHPDQFLVGNGANEVISFIIKAFCQEGDNIVTADKTFAVYEWVATFSGLKARLTPLKDFSFDDEAMVAEADERTKVVFLCNPNNPTGTYWNEEKLREFLIRTEERRIVVVDEAYMEFVENADFPDGIGLLKEFPNLVVFRTFSKMYGLAGLRIGYLAASREVVDVVRRTCIVYSVNRLAQEAALAAVDDDGHIGLTRKLVREEKSYLVRELTSMGLTTQSGEGCFVMVRLPMSDTLAFRRLMARGVMVRSMTGFRFPNWIRVSIGPHEAMEAFIDALRCILGRE